MVSLLYCFYLLPKPNQTKPQLKQLHSQLSCHIACISMSFFSSSPLMGKISLPLVFPKASSLSTKWYEFFIFFLSWLSLRISKYPFLLSQLKSEEDSFLLLVIWSGLFTLLVPSHLFSSSSHSLFLRDAPCSTKQASKSVFWHKSGIALKTFYFPRIFLVFLFWESKDSLWFWTKMCFFFPFHRSAAISVKSSQCTWIFLRK